MQRTHRRVLGATAALVVLASLVPASARASCIPRHVAGLGNACEVPGGYVVRLADGLELFTHGFDALPGIAMAGMGEPDRPVCIHYPDRMFHHTLLYVRPFGTPDRFDELEDDIRGMASVANGVVAANARLFDRKVELQFECDDDDEAVVHEVELGTTASETYVMSDLVNGVRQQGYNRYLAKYWIYYDGTLNGEGAPTGLGLYRRDDRPIAENQNNLGAQYGAVFRPPTTTTGAILFLHEASHTMGAVADSAPHSTLGGHCTDDQDVMCYPDGGPRSDRYRSSRCTREQYDCGHDDYFNPDPDRGSYLAEHWNIGAPYNRFIVGCAYRTGVLSVGTVEPVLGVSTWTHSVPRSCAGTRFALSGVIEHDDLHYIGYTAEQSLLFSDDDEVPVNTADRERLHPPSPAPDFDVCFRSRSAELACFEEIGTDAGVIPKGARSAVITLKAGVESVYVLNAV